MQVCTSEICGAGRWPADVLTEMAFLRLDGSEADVIGKFLPVLRCGPRSALRPCQKSDAALRQQTDCRLSLHDHLLDPVRDTHGHLKLTDVVASRGVREVLERPSCALENCSVIAERARFYNAQIVELEASLPDAEAAVERSQQAVTEKVAARDRAAQKNKEDASGNNAAKNAANLKNAEASLSVKREKAQTATEHVAYVLAKAASARQRARLAEAHGVACVGGASLGVDATQLAQTGWGLPAVAPTPATEHSRSWGFLLFRFMICGETSVVVLVATTCKRPSLSGLGALRRQWATMVG